MTFNSCNKIIVRTLLCVSISLHGAHALAYSKPPTDSDSDGILDNSDNCTNTPPNESVDSNGCSDSQKDSDSDGYKDNIDKFPFDSNEWLDFDGDGIGDNADIDKDGDGVINNDDAFPMNPSETSDLDSDGIGDNSDIDKDGDGHDNSTDSFPEDSTEWADLDADGIGNNSDLDIDDDGRNNIIDAFPYNKLEWSDLDGDGAGDNSDTDIDGDGYHNTSDVFPVDSSEWADLDKDGLGDNSDPDVDGDTYNNEIDAFPTDSSEWSDLDADGSGDNTDSDIDGDGVENDADSFPLNALESSDLDNDGVGDNSDNDIDGDSINNAVDAFPFDKNEWLDTDGDFIGNNADRDDDADGMPDTFENQYNGLNSLIKDGHNDLDNDGISNLEEYLAGSNPDDKEAFAYAADHRGLIYKIKLYSGKLTTIVAIKPKGFFTPSAAAISPMGLLYIADSYSNSLYSINIATKEISPAIQLSENIDRIGMSFDDIGQLWITTDNAHLFAVNTSNGVMTIKGGHKINNIDSLTWNGNTLVGIASNSQNELYSIERANRPASIVSQLKNLNLSGKTGIAFQNNSKIWGIEENGNIFLVESTSGEIEMISTFDSSLYHFNALAMAFDSDQDGLPDGWEDANQLDKFNPSDADSNNDSDELSNIEEFIKGTNPTLSDTDSDGFDDHDDLFPNNKDEWFDNDNDLIGDNEDQDDDNDNFMDSTDPFPLDANKPQWIKKKLHDIPGAISNSTFSMSADSIGDINSDGHEDFLIGRKNDNSVKVYSGADARVLHNLNGPQYSNFGDVVANVGDINGDAVMDFAVSAPLLNQVFVFSGSDASELYKWIGGKSYGASLSSAGDVNNDGIQDIIIGAPDDNKGGSTTRTGSLEVRSGVDGSILHFIQGGNNKAFLGYSVSDLDDINNDGYDDFAAKINQSTRNNQSVVAIYSGKDKRVLRMLSVNYGSTFGNYLENVGDLNNDGVNDLAISATEEFSSVYIYSGKTLDLLSVKEADSNHSGYVTANAGDVDGDGINDHLMNIGITGSGKVWLVSGASNNTIYEFSPTAVDNGFGYALAVADVNSDSKPDFIIGASKNGRIEVLTLLLDSDGDGIADEDDSLPLVEN